MTVGPRYLRDHRESGGHLGDLVHDYVDDLLDPPVAHRADQHLLVCALCRHEVEQERRLINQLRGHHPDPVRHQSLVDGLIGLADHEPIPRPPAGPPLVTQGAPPQHHSARTSVTAALVAVVGCAGVALVVSSSPVRPGQNPRVAPAQVQIRPVVSSGGVGTSAVSRADLDASASFAQPRASVPIPSAGAAIKRP
ncbi:anti-sigma factor family protein [Demetria terragena]|uniref:anti-sigma factor family protein n=1 Tax=Demetria terragena TaxID=63959 RepID=UPI00036F0EAA|nr:zf-HC2 domain-containing protein [Demetria terragena]